MASKDTTKTFQVVTANRLDDGAIVYLRLEDGVPHWVPGIDRATVVEDTETDSVLAIAQEQENENVVVAPYAMEITGRHEPLSAREQIRAHGPSVKYGRDALEPDFSI